MNSQAPVFCIYPICKPCDFTISLKLFKPHCLFLISSIPGLCDNSEIYLHGCHLKLNFYPARSECLTTTIFRSEKKNAFRHTWPLISLSFGSLQFLKTQPFSMIKDLFWTFLPFLNTWFLISRVLWSNLSFHVCPLSKHCFVLL